MAREGEAQQADTASDYAPLQDTSPPRQSAAAAMASTASAPGTAGLGRESDRLLGTLVHRLVQRVGMSSDLGDERLMSVAADLVRPDESIGADRLLLEQTVAAFKTLCWRPELRDVYQSGDALHEVPFTLVAEDRIVRGTIDCLVRTGDRVTILEFKTGRRRADHEVQVELYRRAVRSIFPDAAVDARVIYAEDAGA